MNCLTDYTRTAETLKPGEQISDYLTYQRVCVQEVEPKGRTVTVRGYLNQTKTPVTRIWLVGDRVTIHTGQAVQMVGVPA